MQTPFISPSYNSESFVDRQNLINAVNNLINGSFAIIRLDNTVKEPDAVDGAIAYSDGVTWNPGSGEGFYMRLGDAWYPIRKANDTSFACINLSVRTAAPSPLAEGLVAFADGSSWNPGSGRGVYIYSSSAWHLLRPVDNTSFTSIKVDVRTSAPTAAEGTIAFADGSSWNPGGGRGYYCYLSSAWKQIRFTDNTTFSDIVLSNPSGTPAGTTGKLMFTSGSPWNPGKGAGVYIYYNSAWHLLRLEEDNGFMSILMGVNTSAPSASDGVIAFADGSSWNPGSGKGFYGYYNSAWHFLG